MQTTENQTPQGGSALLTVNHQPTVSNQKYILDENLKKKNTRLSVDFVSIIFSNLDLTYVLGNF